MQAAAPSRSGRHSLAHTADPLMTDRSPHGAHSHRFPPADNQPHRTLASSPPKAHSKRHSPKPKPCCSPPWPAARAARPSRPPWRTPGKRCVRLGWGDEGLVGCRSATQRGRRHMAGWRRRARDGAHTGAPNPAADRIHKPPHWAFGPLWHGGAGGAPASNRSTRRGHGPGPLPMFFSPPLCLADNCADHQTPPTPQRDLRVGLPRGVGAGPRQARHHPPGAFSVYLSRLRIACTAAGMGRLCIRPWRLIWIESDRIAWGLC